MKSIVELKLTEEQEMLRKTLQQFVEKEVKPDCRRRERTQAT